MNVFN